MSASNSPIRVLRLISRMNVGGPAVQISGLMRTLPKDEFEQVLVTGFCDQGELDLLEASHIDIPVTRVSGFGRRISGVSDLKAFLQIRRLMKQFNPHIIHTHTAKAGVLGRIASLTTSQSLIRIHTFHGHLLHGYFGKFKTNLVIAIEKFLALFTHQLVAVGQQVCDDLISAGIGSLDKFNVIGPGLELRELPNRLTAQDSLGIQNHNFTISWVGRLVPIKAPFRILEVARACIANELQVRFVVVGDGPLKRELQDLALKEQLPIDFLGWQSAIEPVLAVTDLMLLTSLNEGMPVSLIEAQMAGIPVISTDVGSVSEVIKPEESGYCLNYSSLDFAMKIAKLVNDGELYKEFCSAAKGNAETNFSLKRLANDYSKLYKKSINEASDLPIVEV